jgi:hypothetical protein
LINYILYFTGSKFSSQKEVDELKDRRQNGGDSSELPSFSNPCYQSVMPITPSSDNYINMPQQKKSVYDKKRSPTESRSDNEDRNIPNPSLMSTTELEQELSHKTSPHSATLEGNLHNGMKYQNAFLNPNYQSQIKTKNDTYVNVPRPDLKTSDASSGFQSDADDCLCVA